MSPEYLKFDVIKESIGNTEYGKVLGRGVLGL